MDVGKKEIENERLKTNTKREEKVLFVVVLCFVCLSKNENQNSRMTQSFFMNTVRRLPRRMVPPRCVFEISGMSITTGCGVSGFTSVEFAFSQPSTFRANSVERNIFKKIEQEYQYNMIINE